MTREQADTLRPGDRLTADLFGTGRRNRVTFDGWENGKVVVIHERANGSTSYAVFIEDIERRAD